MEVVWRFGNFGDRRGVKLVVPDANGNLVTFSMKGEGAGDVLGGSDFTEISLVGTNARTSVNITTKGGATTLLHDVTSTNGLGLFNAPKANLQGDFVADGIIRFLNLGDVTDSTLTFGAGADLVPLSERISMTLGHVENLSVDSEMRIHLFKVKDWLDTDATRDTILAPRVNSLNANGDFQADYVATGADAYPFSLGRMTVKGEINSVLTLPSGAGTIDVGGWSGGSMDGSHVNRLIVRGDLIDTDLRLSGIPGAPNQFALGSMLVTREVADSLIDVHGKAGPVRVGQWNVGSVLAVGVDSGGDGTFFDGNETATGGSLAAFYARKYATDNGGMAFGIAVDALAKLIQLKSKSFTSATLPYLESDLHLVVL